MTDAGQPIEFSPSSVGAGNVPARTRRQIVVRESPVRVMTSGGRSIASFMRNPLSSGAKVRDRGKMAVVSAEK